MNKLIAPAMLAGLLVVGCTQAPGLSPSSTVEGNASLEVTPQIQSGGLMTQALVNNYTASSINHMLVKLFKVNGNTEQPVVDASSQDVVRDIEGTNLTAPVVFSHLGANTTYRIRAYAYKAAGTADANLISTSDANSYIDVTLTNNDRPTLATLRIKLVDVLFSGEATSSGVTVTNGGYSTDGPERID